MVKENTRSERESGHNSSEVSSLIVYNDDVNTFNHVIDTLVEVCKHDQAQAEQCTLIIHYKGKCAVKSGSKKTLKTMRTKILERNITAKVE